MARRLMACCILLAALCATGAARAEGRDPARVWALGWDDGLTLRRVLGDWELGLSAGPNDYRSDDDTRTLSPDLPDSVNGSVTSAGRDRRESGFVRLHVARPLASYRTLVLSGVAGADYSWSDESNDDRSYYAWDEGWRTRRTDTFTDGWRVMAGARLSWFPVPFLSLETEFGLALRWSDTTTTTYDQGPNDAVPTRERRTASNQYFEDFGPYSLTTDVQLVVWF